jgi:hypothetical protein
MKTEIDWFLEQRGRLQQEIEERQKKLDALRTCEEIFKGGETRPVKSAPVQSKPPRSIRQPIPSTPHQATNDIKHADIAEKILRERGPLTADAIARLFEDEGRKTTTNSLRTILSREKGKRFERNAKGEWRIKKAHKGA